MCLVSFLYISENGICLKLIPNNDILVVEQIKCNGHQQGKPPSRVVVSTERANSHIECKYLCLRSFDIETLGAVPFGNIMFRAQLFIQHIWERRNGKSRMVCLRDTFSLTKGAIDLLPYYTTCSRIRNTIIIFWIAHFPTLLRTSRPTIKHNLI